MKTLIIIPAFNESENIVNTINKIKNYKKIKLDYIVINDGSTDNTKLILENNKINYIDLKNNLGIGAAVQTGYKFAYDNDYDIAIQFDGDGQHDINYIDKLINPLKSNSYDMVIGSRFIGNESKFKSTKMRRLGIFTISFIIEKLTRKKIKDTTSGFRGVNKKVIKLFANDYPFDYPEPITTLELIKNNYKIKEVPVKMNEREFGKSSINSIKSIKYMFNVVITMLIINFFNKKKED